MPLSSSELRIFNRADLCLDRLASVDTEALAQILCGALRRASKQLFNEQTENGQIE